MLEGIKVLSFTHFLQGPSAVQVLADLGADVTKVEPPRGAFERGWSGQQAYMNGVSLFYLLANRNQRSLAVDMHKKAGRVVLRRLIQKSDVIVENFRPGVMDKYGFGYDDVRKINPRIVYCSCSGYGSDGPYRNRPGQDMLIQCLSGFAWLNGSKNAPPTPIGTAIVDQHAAILAALGVVSALYERTKTGEGKKVDSNLLNAAVDLQVEPLVYHLNNGPLWDRSEGGLADRFHQAPYGIYQTKDGWIGISMSKVEHLSQAFGDDSFSRYTTEDQFYKREEVSQKVANHLRTRTTEEWVAIFDRIGVWYSPVNNYDQLVEDPQIQWNEVIMTMEHPDAGAVKVLSHPVRYNGEAPKVYRHAPRLGEHSREVLSEIDYTDEEISELFTSGVIYE